MSDPKRWADDESGATPAERAALSAGATGKLALGADRKAELRRALAIAISVPVPPDGGPADGQGGGPPPPAPPPLTPPAVGEAASGLGAIGKLIFSGKASGALAAFALAAGSTAVVLGVATVVTQPPPSGSSVTPAASFVNQADALAGPPHAIDDLPDAPPTVPAPSAAADPVVPSAARSGRSFGTPLGEKAPEEVAAPTAPTTLPAPTEAPAAPASTAAAPPASGAVLVIPPAPDVRLADEIARVRAVRDALRSGNAALTFSLLDALDREHPGGTLGQEREAMRIEALAGSGRGNEARTRADAFLARHPGSAFASSVGRFATR